MAIYMKLSGINGPVEVSDFKDQFELTSFTHSATRDIGQPTRSQQNRGRSEPHIDYVYVQKMWDGVSSSKLFQSLVKGDMNMTATISFTNADNPPATYLQVVLSNAAIAHYSVSGAGTPPGGGTTDLPTENLTLSFTAIEWTPYTIGSDKKPKKGDVVKHDLTTGNLS